MPSVTIFFCVLCLPKRIYGDNEKYMIVKYVRMYYFVIVTLCRRRIFFVFNILYELPAV